jgi:hypothetical protein
MNDGSSSTFSAARRLRGPLMARAQQAERTRRVGVLMGQLMTQTDKLGSKRCNKGFTNRMDRRPQRAHRLSLDRR